MVLVSSVIVAIGAASAASSQLPLGRYLLTASGDAWLKQGVTGLTASAGGANCFFLVKGQAQVLTVSDTTLNGFVAVIQLVGAGHVSIARIDA